MIPHHPENPDFRYPKRLCDSPSPGKSGFRILKEVV
jgi:hypothetical protein